MSDAKPPVKTVDDSKSGIINLKVGDILFNENDQADCLYIIQKGQLRLFRPKGRGYIELAILRVGEVIGEMAYFDEGARRRSCSAQAVLPTDVIKISFKAFEKTMTGLNPWFKTIINTLADRLRKTNEQVKALESNSVGFGKGGKVADYVFLHNADIVKILSLIFMITKSHGEVKDGRQIIHFHKLKFYLNDIFAIQEIKFEEFIQLLHKEKFVEIVMSPNNLPELLKIFDLDLMRSLLIFFNTQRTLVDEKKLSIGKKCEQFLNAIVKQLDLNPPKDQTGVANISTIITQFKKSNELIVEDDLKDARDAGLVGDIMVGEGNILSADVQYLQIKKLLPAIRLTNALKDLNEAKAKKY